MRSFGHIREQLWQQVHAVAATGVFHNILDLRQMRQEVCECETRVRGSSALRPLRPLSSSHPGEGVTALIISPPDWCGSQRLTGSMCWEEDAAAVASGLIWDTCAAEESS